MRVRLAGAALLVVSVCGVAADLPGADRARLGDEAERLMAAGQFAEAVAVARELVASTENDDPAARELPQLYQRLGQAQLQAGDAAGAQQSLLRALDMLSVTESMSSRRLVEPLRTLASAYQAQEETSLAIASLRRAMAVSHRALGLFNREQLPMIESLIQLYQQADDEQGVDREMQHSIMVADRVYGRDDPRLLPLLRRLAEHYEATRRMALARDQWTRTVEIASREGDARNAAMVTGLLGVARSHRLQFVVDPGSVDMPRCRRDPATGAIQPLTICTDLGRPVQLNDEGRVAAARALEILDSTPSAPQELLAAALLELGDWHMTARQPGLAVPLYQRAWPLLASLATPGEPNPLATPRPLDYRTPAAATQYVPLAGGSPAAMVPIEFRVTVRADGGVADITPVSDASEARLSRLRRALEDTWFRPRFVEGEPVATEGFPMVDYWLEPAAATLVPFPEGAPATIDPDVATAPAP